MAVSSRTRSKMDLAQAPNWPKRPADDSGSGRKPAAGKRRLSMQPVAALPDDSTKNPHPDLLTQWMAKLYDTGNGSDCTLISRDGQEFPAHRTVLIMASTVFGRMFATNMTEAASGICRIANFDGNVIQALLKFIYKGDVTEIGECVKEVLDFAQQYDIGPLTAACEQVVIKKVTVDDAPENLLMAKQRELKGLKSQMARFIADNVDKF